MRTYPHEGGPEKAQKRSLFQRIDPKPIHMQEVLDPIVIGRHLTVLLPSIAYAIVFSFAGVFLTVEIPQIFILKFGFNPQQLGLQFIAIIIGYAYNLYRPTVVSGTADMCIAPSLVNRQEVR